jgi:hypothetical protein
VNYGFEERPSLPARIFGFVLGAVVGVAAGYGAFFVTMAFGTMIGDAMPSLHGIGMLAVYLAFAALPAWSFGKVSRTKLASIGARTMGYVGFLTLAVLATIELTGIAPLYPRNVHFYLVPVPMHR